MMRDSILYFQKQFEFNPKIENASSLKRRFKKFLLCGMGGSHLAGDLLKIVEPKFNMVIHSDYGLREVPDLNERLVIVSSYSGNTEEEIDNFREARKRRLAVAVIASGGELIGLAKRFQIPYVELPSGIQPRMAIGYSLLGLLKMMGEDAMVKTFQVQGLKLHPKEFEVRGKRLAKKLSTTIPVVYSSVRNKALVYYWKITLNETGKVSAFYNVFPELNHNEMQGYDMSSVGRDTRSRVSTRLFHFILLEDVSDHPRVQRRTKVMKQMFLKRKLTVETIPLKGATLFEKVFNTVFLAAWAAYYVALRNRQDPEKVLLIEEFKKHLSYVKQ